MYIACTASGRLSPAAFAASHDFVLMTPTGTQRFELTGTLKPTWTVVTCLTGWALAGRGIVLKPAFKMAEHLASGALVPVCEAMPPLPDPTRLPLPAQAAAGAEKPALHRLHGGGSSEGGGGGAGAAAGIGAGCEGAGCRLSPRRSAQTKTKWLCLLDVEYQV